MSAACSWLSVTRNESPLIVSIPHAGTEIPAGLQRHFLSLWLARKDADWWIPRLYDFAAPLGATVILTSLSRSVVDVNRDPSGRSLYPGQNTTELCPTTTFDGEMLYREASAPDAAEVARRSAEYFAPYHLALEEEIGRLRMRHAKLVVFEAHSIRSRIPRLFEGELPHVNIGTNSGESCGARLATAIEMACDSDAFSRVTNGRFRGGYTTRHYGDPRRGVHAVQIELAMRAYMAEPEAVSDANWPAAYDPLRAAPMRAVLQGVLAACLRFASES